MLQPEPGQVAFFPNVDAIQEFKIESNSPPAEFGRFNGGVVNLTTKSGSNALRGTRLRVLPPRGAERAQLLRRRPTPVKPQFRRNQFGGVLGGPIRRDRTFFFVDYQGQRQTIGRTVISTVPTLLQRQGIFTEAIGGRVPAIYDPATTVAGRRRRRRGRRSPATRSRWSGWIRSRARCWSAIRCRPAPARPTTIAASANETVDQDQFSVRLDHRFAATAIRCSAG